MVLTPGDTVAPEFTASQEKNQTHSHVAKAWYDKTLSFDQVMAAIEDERKQREDIEDDLHSMVPDIEDDQFVLRYKDGRAFTPTDHALSQMATYLGMSTWQVTDLRMAKRLSAKIQFTRDAQDAEALCVLLENGLRRMPSCVRKFRTYKDGTMRAFLSEQYAYIDNRWYLECINQIIPDGRFSHWRGDADQFNGNVLIPDTIMDYPDGDSDYGGMMNCRNSELGNGKNIQCPSIFRAICMNGCIWGQTKGKKTGKVHRGEIDLVSLKKDIYKNITEQIPLFTVSIQQFLATRGDEVGTVNMSNVIAQAAMDYKLSSEEATQVAKEFNQYEKGDRNRFGLINAITRAGQKFSNARVIEMDAIGGALIMANWNSFLTKAKAVTDEQRQEIFGLNA